MLTYTTLEDLSDNYELAATMFWDRRKQFCDRLQWPLETNRFGYEQDEYDTDDAMYIIVEDAEGRHAGSMRLIPTTRPTMLHQHFKELNPNIVAKNSRVWECTRLCLSPKATKETALQIFAAAARFGLEANLTHLVGIFDARMIRVYSRNGVPPTVIGSHEYAYGKVAAGFWSFDENQFNALLKKSKLDPVVLELAIANIPTVSTDVHDQCGVYKKMKPMASEVSFAL